MEKDADLHEQANQADEAETNNPNKGATRPLRGAAKRSHERKLELDALLDCNEECGSINVFEWGYKKLQKREGK